MLIPKVGDYMHKVQRDLVPSHRKIVTDWMLEVGWPLLLLLLLLTIIVIYYLLFIVIIAGGGLTFFLEVDWPMTIISDISIFKVIKI